MPVSKIRKLLDCKHTAEPRVQRVENYFQALGPNQGILKYFSGQISELLYTSDFTLLAVGVGVISSLFPKFYKSRGTVFKKLQLMSLISVQT